MEFVFEFLEFIVFTSLPQFNRPFESVEFYNAIDLNLFLVIFWIQIALFYIIAESDEFASR